MKNFVKNWIYKLTRYNYPKLYFSDGSYRLVKPKKNVWKNL